ncbi:unnamed protein product [Leptidea sinapis]|uniref:Uncharacterized protein n=1 Tax=Leptidea sinapis TaxID=189913 RepID=A0A5E4PTC4_9NEOP|nr:unnamed protein product [Leptidea sinapis]
MTLDKQRILSELGSVVNQLQSADCGCIGNLFGNSNQSNNQTSYSNMNCHQPYGGYGHSCCYGSGRGHGYGYNLKAESGEPYSNQQPYGYQQAPSHCMGRCNPAKLYADTYGYLNQNLMQPTVKEVYDDLKSITPDNTIMNSPIGKQFGLAGAGVTSLGKGNQNLSNNNGITNSPINGTAQPSQNMPGMGPEILQMVNKVSNNYKQNMSASQAPHVATENIREVPNATLQPNAVSQNPGNYMNPQTIYASGIPDSSQYMKQASITQSQIPGQMPYTVNGNDTQNGMQNISGNSGQLTQNIQPNNLTQQMRSQQRPMSQQPYGMHTQGINKFNEMFPGVTQGLGGDLGFDPMTIAIQMNPANHQQQAYKMMHNLIDNHSNVNKNMASAPSYDTSQQKMEPERNLNPPALHSSQLQAQQIQQNLQPFSDTQNASNTNQYAQHVPTQLQHLTTTTLPQHTEQIYYNTQLPNKDQAQLLQENKISENNKPLWQNNSQQRVDPNTGASHMTPNLPTLYEGYSTIPQARQNMHPQSFPVQPTQNKEPIYPVDTSKRMERIERNATYNTLGQPVEMLPADLYHQPLPNLPQTLSPDPIQRNRTDESKFSNVKSTVSKTSIMGAKQIGRNPSRNQLQHIYNQYRGSQSFTQQNVKPIQEQGATQSTGQLNVPQVQTQHQNRIPIEKVGGDSPANVVQDQLTNKVEHVIAQIGDVPQNNKVDTLAEKDVAVNNRKVRNGLQDMVFTSYPISAAWTFHGGSESPRRRF